MKIQASNKTIKTVLLLLILSVAGAVIWNQLHSKAPSQVALPDTELDVDKTLTEPNTLFGEPVSDTLLPPGVNAEFYDSPEIQVAWMNRAKDVIGNNLPAGATHAEVSGGFFHRGFKGWAVTCGNVSFFNEEALMERGQRFVFPGVQTIYYENDIPNFEIYWEKVCEQTSDAYLPDNLKYRENQIDGGKPEE